MPEGSLVSDSLDNRRLWCFKQHQERKRSSGWCPSINLQAMAMSYTCTCWRSAAVIGQTTLRQTRLGRELCWSICAVAMTLSGEREAADTKEEYENEEKMLTGQVHLRPTDITSIVGRPSEVCTPLPCPWSGVFVPPRKWREATSATRSFANLICKGAGTCASNGGDKCFEFSNIQF